MGEVAVGTKQKVKQAAGPHGDRAFEAVCLRATVCLIWSILFFIPTLQFDNPCFCIKNSYIDIDDLK